MQIIDALHNFLRQSLLTLHAARLHAFMAAVEAGLAGASLSITVLGRALSGPAFINHKIKRIDRLVGNSHLRYASKRVRNEMTLYQVQHLLGHTNPSTTSRYSHLETAGISKDAAKIWNRK